MKRLLMIKSLSILGIVVSFGGISYNESSHSSSGSNEVSTFHEDEVIAHMKEVVKDVSLIQKKRSTENYVLGIGELIGVGKSDFSPEQIKIIESFAKRYLSAEFKTESDLILSFRSMISAVLGASGLPDCDGDWVGSGGYLNNCDEGTEIIFAGIPTGACVYECLDPYIVVDCVLYAPCIPT